LLELAPWQGEVEKLVRHGLLTADDGQARLTARGKLLADAVAEVFV